MTTPLAPETIQLDGKNYTLTKFPATEGREIIMQYPSTALPKVGDYKQNHALMLKMMKYVGVEVEGREGLLMLTTEALVNNHVDKPETLIKLEWAMIQHNFDFFKDGRALGFLGSLLETIQSSISETLMGLLQQSSGKS